MPHDHAATRIDRIRIPERVGADGSRDFEAYVELANAVEADAWGHDDFAVTARELLPNYHDTRYYARTALLARDRGEAVGYATVRVDLGPDAEGTVVFVGVRPDRRRRGTGRALLSAAEAIAAEHSRPVVTSFSAVPLARLRDATGELLGASAGDAVVPADDGAARFALAHGYALGQVERLSRLDLDAHPPASPAAPEGYRFEMWTDATPDGLLDAYAEARAHMATDVPTADLDVDPEVWDADRVRTYERERAEGGLTLLVAAALADDGSIAGYTELELPDDTRAAFQNDTLVLRAHRGHGLGRAVKLANLAQLARVAPDRRRVYTWNADENEHMLAINVALGFETLGYEAIWQKRLADSAEAPSAAITTVAATTSAGAAGG